MVHLGVERVDPLAPAGTTLPADYLLFVGMRDGYKNFGNMVRAIGALPNNGEPLRLVCFGGGPLSAAEVLTCVEAGVSETRLIQISGDDRLLAHAYHNAVALVYPSLYEGFGLPLIEAMTQGCRWVCSAGSCFPEICGNAAEFFSPQNVDSIQAALARVLGSKERRDALIGAGISRAARFAGQLRPRHG